MRLTRIKTTAKKWLFFTFVTAFSIYWTANLVLWYPWSWSPILGITLMLTVAPFIWLYGVIKCLKTYTGENIVHGAIWTAFVYILVAVVGDYIFFGLMRKVSFAELYHPTTFYGYAFLMSLPFIIVLFFRNKNLPKVSITGKEILRFGLSGLLSIAALFAIIKFNITL